MMLRSNNGLFTILILFLTLLATRIEAQDLDLIEEKTFSVSSGDMFAIKADLGDVKVESWDRNEVSVKYFGDSDAKEKITFKMEKTSKGVEVFAEKEGSWLVFSWGNIKAKFEVMVPKKFEVYVSTAGGDVEVKGVEGTVQSKTSGGDVHYQAVAGKITARTSGGDIESKDTKGEGKFNTSGGDVKLRNHDGEVDASTSGGDVDIVSSNGKVYASTSGGDVGLKYEGTNYGVKLKTSGGDIYVSLPKDFKADAELRTTGGDVYLELEATSSSKISSSKFIGKINGGGENFECFTSGGDIKVVNK